MSLEHEHIGKAAVAAKDAMQREGHEITGLVLIIEADGEQQMAAYPHDNLRATWALVDHARSAVEDSFAGEAGLN